MKLDQKYRLKDSQELQNCFQIYSLLQSYYTGSLLHKEKEWDEIVSLFREQEFYLANRDYKKGVSLLAPYSTEAIFDFNRLFVGPDKLLAPPYEGAYRNSEGLLMQEETLKVRDFYLSVGLAVEDKNRLPDDFLGLELEFICYLLYQAAENRAKGDYTESDYYLDKYAQFLDMHVSKWIFQHCQDVLTHGKSRICQGMALITQGFLQQEIKSVHETEGGIIYDQ